jgi:hypothetical protein
MFVFSGSPIFGPRGGFLRSERPRLRSCLQLSWERVSLEDVRFLWISYFRSPRRFSEI